MSSFLSRALYALVLSIALNLISSYLGLNSNFFGFNKSGFGNVSRIKPVKLYGSPLSTCTRRVAVVLKEKGVPYELIPVDLSKGEHKNPEFIENFQPFGQVPVLQDGDFIIYESRAIGRYIATKYAAFGTPNLIPQSDIQAWARFEEAASVEQNNFDPYASGIAVEKVFKLMRGGTTDEKRVADLTTTLNSKLDVYEKILSKRKYLAGDSITLADLYHLSYGTMLTEKLGMDVLTTRPNVARWWKDISSRDSWKAVKDGA